MLSGGFMFLLALATLFGFSSLSLDLLLLCLELLEFLGGAFKLDLLCLNLFELLITGLLFLDEKWFVNFIEGFSSFGLAFLDLLGSSGNFFIQLVFN